MIQFTGIDTKQQNIYSNPRKNNTVQANKRKYNNSFYSVKNKKIGVAEGAELFVGGVVKQGKELINSIIKHPLKTAAVFAATTLGLMALPLIGIPSAVGGGILAIGFAGFAIGKSVNHAIQFSKSNKEGSYDIARLHLQQMGEDTFDLALSVPFVPKAITNIKNFATYGKIGINNTLINELKGTKGSFNKIKALFKADSEMMRNYNFQGALDKNLRETYSPEAFSEEHIAEIRRQVLEFNVPVEKIPEVVLEKYAQARGITTKPNLKYTAMPPNTQGMAVADDCTIYLNNNKPYSGKPAFNEFATIKTELKGNEYFITYKNKNTGAIIVETIEKNLLDRYNALCQGHKTLSPEAAKILTILHEREHIHQFAQAFKMKGFEWMKGNLTPQGKQLFEQMITEMPKVKPGSPEAMLIETYTQPVANGTLAAYIKRPLEIGARNIEEKAFINPIFGTIDEVFKAMKYSKGLSIGENILLNDARIESSKV